MSKAKNNTYSYCCGSAKIWLDEDGYIIKAEGLLGVIWGKLDLDEKVIGKHVIELARIIKKYSLNNEGYVNFLENVVLDFYAKKELLNKKQKKLTRKNYGK